MENLGHPLAAKQGGNQKTVSSRYYTTADPTEQFKAAMQEAGIIPPDAIIGDGQLHRFNIDGKPNGAYVLHLDGCAAGYFQDFKQRIKQTWKITGHFQPLSDLQRQAFKAQFRKQDAERQAEQDAKHMQAAEKAACIWANAKPAPSNHPYLVKKRINPHGARLGRNNALIIPLYNVKSELAGLQFISETGGKRFLSGSLKKGCFWQIGETTATILIAEGYATAASLYEDTGFMTVIAYDCGNLKDVSMVIRSLYPDAKIIICGDNDKNGAGQKAAKSAASACSGKYLLPPVVGHDWNDMLTMEVSHG